MRIKVEIKKLIFQVLFIFAFVLLSAPCVLAAENHADSITVAFKPSAGTKFVGILDIFLNTTATPASSSDTYIIKFPSPDKYSVYMNFYSSLSYVKAVNGKPILCGKSPVNHAGPGSGAETARQDELILRLKPGADRGIVEVLAIIYEFKIVSEITDLNAYLIRTPDRISAAGYTAFLKLSPYIAAIEPNLPIKAF